MAQRVFAQKHLPDDPLFKLVSLFYEVVPPVLTAGGKVRRPESHIHYCFALLQRPAWHDM